MYLHHCSSLGAVAERQHRFIVCETRSLHRRQLLFVDTSLLFFQRDSKDGGTALTPRALH
jgi:hypothetical protein